MRNFRKLETWRLGMSICQRVYDETRMSPTDERFCLTQQMRRSAVSIPSNIAEGAERNSRAEYTHFLHIAKGSAAELRTQLYIAQRIGIVDQTTQTELTDELKQISAIY